METFTRDCGCSYMVASFTELPEAVRQRLTESPYALINARFTHRCTAHATMCRNLEQWEIDMLRPEGLAAFLIDTPASITDEDDPR